MTDRQLLERDDELAVLAGAVASAQAGEGSVVVALADAGLGKSELLDEAARVASSAGLRVLRARGSELERDFALGVVLQLLEPAARGGAVASGTSALALELLRGEHAAADSSLDRLLTSLQWLVVDLAEAGPLVLIVDDAHWADAASWRFLVDLARRAADLPFTLIVAARPREPGAEQAALDRLSASAMVLAPGPLSREATAAVVGTAGFAGAEAASGFVAACHDATGGNPLLLRELLHALAEEGVTPDEHATERVQAIGPEAISRAVWPVLRRLGAPATALARAVAVLGDGTDLRLACALASLDPGEGAEAAQALEQAGLFVRRDGLAFVHPILRSAVYEALPATERGLAHRLAARLMFDSERIERVAAHLLSAPGAGEAWAVQALREAASRALARGVPALAAEKLRRALDEPAPAADRPGLLAELGRAESAAGLPTAPATLGAAIAAADPGEAATRLTLDLAASLHALGRHEEAVAALEPQLGGYERGDLALEVEAAWVASALWVPSLAGQALARVEPLLSGTDAPRTGGQRVLLGQLAGAETLRNGNRVQAIEWALRAWGDGALLEHTSADDAVIGAITAALSEGEAFGECRAVLDACIRDARRRGLALAFATLSYVSGVLHLYEGNLPDAIADLEQALDDRLGWELFAPAAAGLLSRALLETGDAVRARRATVLPPGVEERFATSAIRARLLAARGHLALAGDDAPAALALFEEAGALCTTAGVTNARMMPWRSGRALALARVRRGDEALAVVEEELGLLRAWGAPAGIAAALRLRAALNPGSRLDDLREACALLEGSPARLERASALAALGATLRAAGMRQEARTVLEDAAELAVACGARPLAERARDDLVAIGGRPGDALPPSTSGLTPSELRVARLATEGLTNRAIAEALFVTPKAIEWHLGNVYRKLGVGSRHDLATALAPAD